ncbi:MAG: hypothetical protein HEP71_03335 [Roseivirga sp.]|nr:hypothetical protein [Roseivirga sp.]
MFRLSAIVTIFFLNPFILLAQGIPAPAASPCITYLSWLIPIILLALFIIIAWAIRKKYSLKNALSELKTIDKETVHVESSSRLIAFLSGIIALTTSLTITIISMYVYLETGKLPDFQNLVNALLALGIGVVPYSINKVAGIFK